MNPSERIGFAELVNSVPRCMLRETKKSPADLADLRRFTQALIGS